MKKFPIIFAVALLGHIAYSQDTEKPFKPVFKKGYIRLGTSISGKIDNSISPLENLKKGNTGAEPGYNIEFGHIFYFLNRRELRLVNVGLDWTIAGLGIIPSTGWSQYVKLDPSAKFYDGTYSLYATSKLGPTVTFNPVKKLVAEVRGQLTYGLRLATNMGFEGQDYHYKFQDDGFFGTTGLGTSFGATLRYSFFGFSVDYENVKTTISSAIKEKGSTEIISSQKVPFRNLFLKLNFSL